jgi:endonuclease III
VIDPQNIVKSDYTDSELQELLIFTICVAGKTAATIAPRVNKMFTWMKERTGSDTPLDHPHLLPLDLWSDVMRFGIGCYRMKARAILEVAHMIHYDNFDLKSCTVEELEEVYGIGPKSAKAFVMWSRPDEAHAILDTHILKWLKEQGIDNVPKSTPTGKNYARLEQEFLDRVPDGMTAAEFDLKIWKKYANPNTGVTSVY